MLPLEHRCAIMPSPEFQMYTFLFDRKSMSWLLASGAVATFLVFSSGVVVGLWWSLPSAPEVVPKFAGLSDGRQLTTGEQPTVAEKSPPPLAVAPLEEPAPTAPVAESNPAEPRPTAVQEADFYSRQPAVQEAALSSGQVAVQEADVSSGLEERPVREDPWTRSVHPVYSVQVGTFVVESRATVFVDELRTRGWEPYIIETTFPSGRPAITVRVGSYSRLEEALKAAGSFEASEKRATTVRWSDLESPSQGPEARRSS